MFIIGLTGGIGTGKTTVAEVFKKLIIPVYNSDIEAKNLMNTEKELIEKLKDIFGNAIYKDNKLDREKLADLIFNDKQKLNIVNSIVHPAVKKHFNNWADKQNTPYVIKETAILFESGTYKDVNKIISVSAPLELRIERLIKRDNSNRERIMERMNNQIDENFKRNNSDYIINNDNMKLLIPQVLSIHHKILNILKIK
jgi:dephospho-CoA kinase